ncbi:MAG: enoyl-CoA hydratase/isomerase family protein, partial [Novosphingobium sp.]|nr:enoyl-CoA hydratase/isomerase family protein [Novosphingobium sp.]
MSDEVLIRTEGRIGRLSLNRPQALHALTIGMCHAMTEALTAWRDDPAVEAVVLDHSAGRGFCAGGDIAYLRHSVLTDAGVTGLKFFHDEYLLDELIQSYPKPFVSFMDGMTMGGGVGVSQPARYRVATENTRFAMPETGIGLFPDVGGSWYLSRLPGRTGQYLVLTGARLDGAECLWAGLATHYLPSAALDEAKRRIAETPDAISAILRELSVVPPAPKVATTAPQIDRLFAADRLEDVLAALAADLSEWAQAQLATVRTKSPQASKIALRQLADGAKLTKFSDALAMEYRIVSRVLTRPD